MYFGLGSPLVRIDCLRLDEWNFCHKQFLLVNQTKREETISIYKT